VSGPDFSKKFFRVRWALFYESGSFVYGPWNLKPTNKAEQASFQPREGLERAELHAQDLRSQETHRVEVCPGSEYKEFRLIGGGVMPLVDFGNAAHRMEAMVVGIQLIRNSGHVTCFFCDGTIVRRDK